MSENSRGFYYNIILIINAQRSVILSLTMWCMVIEIFPMAAERNCLKNQGWLNFLHLVREAAKKKVPPLVAGPLRPYTPPPRV